MTLPWSTYEALQVRADAEGRSLSNLAAFLLESAIKGPCGLSDPEIRLIAAQKMEGL
ncbi:MAG: hypothetical protein NTW51_16390 [Cyanobacteria bacterium]|nr:hypothetical protein [Cyanobacteriota bacterium]